MLHTRETFKRNVLNIYMYIYIAESFCCSLETTTTLFISYTPIQNVFVLKKNIKFKILKKKKKQNVVLGKMLQSPLDSKEIKPVNLKGNQPQIFIGRTDTKAKVQILWSPDTKSWLAGKDLVAGIDWGQKKGRTEDEMVGWHCQLNGHEFVQTPGDSKGQGSLPCCSSWGCRVIHDLLTEQQQNKI